MLLSAILPLVLATSSAQGFVRFPPGATPAGLMELTGEGEVWFLPVHNRTPFRAVVATRTRERCSAMEQAMLDVEGYKKRWPIDEVKILERSPDRIRYEMDLALTLAPTIEGIVERQGKGRVHFSDPGTGARSLWSLTDLDGGCHMTFSIAEAAGKQGSFVTVVRAIEASAGDSTNIAAAMATTRGYTKPQNDGRTAFQLGQAGERAWRAIADEGTAIRLERRPNRFPRYHLTRRVAVAPDRVLWSIRDRRRYVEKADVFKDVKDRGREVRWSLAYFGGRVSFQTEVTEEGDPASPAGMVITERVKGGDIDEGVWRWTVRAVEGGTQVDLFLDLDVVPGSTIMSAIAGEDPMFREGMALQIAVQLAGRVIGGKPIGRRPLEGVPVAAVESAAPVPAKAD